MAKLVEQIKTYDEEIKVGDLVVVNTHTGNDPICIVTREIRKKDMVLSNNELKFLIMYDCVNLNTGECSSCQKDDVTKYHGTITLSNE